VNDSAQELENLFRAMLAAQVKPYYLHQLDRAPGTARFEVPIAEGRQMLRQLRGRLSGLAWPTYVLDLPNGAGKAPLGPDFARAEAQAWLIDGPLDHAQHRYPIGKDDVQDTEF
jgi:lysine 2,3-aminomutase